MNPKRVLLIDDQIGFTRLLKLTLERKEHHIVREENDSTKAVSAAHEFRPDVILCDVDMPKMDGGEVARQIRQDPRLAHVPFIFLTSLATAQDAERNLGGFPVLSKPVTVETVQRCIEEQTARIVKDPVA